MGNVQQPLGGSASALIDDRNGLAVELLHSGMRIEASSDAALASGANLALVGSELIQFGRVEQLSERTYRLTRLLRGRRGTEWAASSHGPDEPFTLLAAESVLPIIVPDGALGSQATLVAAGVGDETAGVTVSCPLSGESLRPPAPVHLQAAIAANGDLVVRWTRRSRFGWTWTSEAETPLGEELEAYRVAIASLAATRVFEVDQPTFVYAGAQRAADGMDGPLTVSVVQIGTHSASRAAQATVL
jgi:hypothetical protein